MIRIIFNLCLSVTLILLICYLIHQTYRLDTLQERLTVLQKAHNNNAEVLISTLEMLDEMTDDRKELD